MISLRNIAVALAFKVLNRYEAGIRFSPDRSSIPGELQDAWFDADHATRSEIARKAISFESNNAILLRMVDVFEEYTVGPTGLICIPASSDPQWNRRAATEWGAWCRFPDLVSRQSFGTLQSLIARTWFIQGEVFILKTSGAAANGSRPRIALIEPHRVGTPPTMWAQEGKTIIDGVEIDEVGRPVAYWIQEGMDLGKYRRVTADKIIHVMEPTRVGQYRAVSMLHGVLNDLHDLDDLQILEMRAAKDQAEKSTFIKGVRQGLNPTNLRKEAAGVVTSDRKDGTQTIESRLRAIRDAHGGRTSALMDGEDVTQFVGVRPSAAVQWYWNYLTTKVCIGAGIPKLLVMPESMQGTVTRADLVAASAFFRARSAIMAEVVREIFIYVIGDARFRSPAIADAPADWTTVRTRPPKSANVDVGRNSNAMIAELEACVRTYAGIIGEDGDDYQDVFRQRFIEEKLLDDLAKEYGVPVERVRKSLVDLLKVQLQLEAAESANKEPKAA